RIITLSSSKERGDLTVSTDRLVARPSRSGISPSRESTERRRNPRIDLPFPAAVRGVDQAGQRFRVDAVLDNLSASGLYVWLGRPVEPGATVFVVVRLSSAPEQQLEAPGVAARAVALRLDRLPDGRYGSAMTFKRARFLYANATKAIPCL